MERAVSPRIKHHVDPLRYPNIQAKYENKAKNSFSAVRVFGELVEEMVTITKGKENAVYRKRHKADTRNY